MGATVKPLLLNLGCGFDKLPKHVNVDAFANCEPDVVHDLNVAPYPWPDNSVDGIEMWHTLEHLENWWLAITECARILKPGGYLHIRVPDESSTSALTYRDHLHVFSRHSFHGIYGRGGWGANAWAHAENDTVPLAMHDYVQVPFQEYEWMARWCPWLLAFCSRHMRNFIWEQRFYFIKAAGPVIEVG